MAGIDCTASPRCSAAPAGLHEHGDKATGSPALTDTTTIHRKGDPMKSAWPSRLRQRLLLYWPLKAFGTSLFMLVFFWAYFSILNHPRAAPVVIPVIWLDQWIAFTPAAFPVYASLWVYVSLPTALMGNMRPLIQFAVWMGAMCLFCLALFWLFPTQTPESGIDWKNYPGLVLIKSVDAAGNACPSLHVASAVFCALWLHRILAQAATPAALRWLSALQCAAIVWSTMASMQHVALDVMSGAAVGLAFAWMSLVRVQNTAL